MARMPFRIRDATMDEPGYDWVRREWYVMGKKRVWLRQLFLRWIWMREARLPVACSHPLIFEAGSPTARATISFSGRFRVPKVCAWTKPHVRFCCHENWQKSLHCREPGMHSRIFQYRSEAVNINRSLVLKEIGESDRGSIVH